MSFQLSLFDAQPDFDASIRRVTENGTVYFSLVDIMAQFIGDPDTTWQTGKKAGTKKKLVSNPAVIWQYTKKRLDADGFDGYKKIIRIKMKDTIGRMQATDCADGQTCLRIVQSISSPKAEPIRQWLAQLGYERLEETANPELGIQRAKDRARQAYARAGKDAQWINTRLDGMVHRNQLTEALNLRALGLALRDCVSPANDGGETPTTADNTATASANAFMPKMNAERCHVRRVSKARTE